MTKSQAQDSSPPLKRRKPNAVIGPPTARVKSSGSSGDKVGSRQMQSLSLLATMFAPPASRSKADASNAIASTSTTAARVSSKASISRSDPPVKTRKLSNPSQAPGLAATSKSGVMDEVVISIESGSDADEEEVDRRRPSGPTRSTTVARGKGKEKIKSNTVHISSGEADPAIPDDLSDVESENTSMMWTELFPPGTIEELAPSKTRIGPLRSWLYESVHGLRPDDPPALPKNSKPPNGSKVGTTNVNPPTLQAAREPSEKQRHALKRMRRMLILSGPAGVGKMTSLRVVASEIGVEVVDWVDESEGFGGWGGGGESSIDRFVSFLSRSSYAPLALDRTAQPMSGPDHLPSSSAPIRPIGRSTPNKPRLILLSSLPSLSTQAQRATFQSALLTFVKSYEPGTMGNGAASCPLAIIIPDEGLSGTAEESWMAKGRSGGGGGGERSEGWNARAIVGEALTHPSTSWMSFPAIAPTFMTKALKRVVRLASSSPISAHIKSNPSDEVIRAIAQTANGDLRSAINSLQFLCMSGNFPVAGGKDSSGEKVKKTGKGSRGGKGGAVSGDKKMLEMLNAISRREQSLGLFHALGKVLYNKRKGDPDDEDAEAEVKLVETDLMPGHLAMWERRPYKNDFDTLLGTVPVDTATFALWLHQNVPQFCEDIEQNQLVLDDLCASDIMKTDTDFWATNVQSIAYAFHVSVRGTIMALPSPVPRNNQKIFKPAYFEMLRRAKESNLAIAAFAASLAPTDENLDGGSAARIGHNAKVWTTEYMPFYRQKKRRDGDESGLLGIDATGLTMVDEAPGQRLAVLLDGDDADMGEGAEHYEEAIDAASCMASALIDTSQAVAPEPGPSEEVTWLEDDDIEDD